MAKKNCTPCRIPPISILSPTIKTNNPRCYFKSNRIMKKLALFLLLVAAALSATAQDTIDRPRSNCLFTWPDIDNDKEILDCFNRFIYMQPYGPNGGCGGQIAKMYYTQTPIQVYGVAAALKMCASPYDFPEGPSSIYPLLDSSLSASFEYLRLSKFDSTGRDLNVLAEAPVFATDTPVCYFQVIAQNPITTPLDPYIPPRPRQVFEVYFDQPVTVSDTFFVGMTRRMGNYVLIDDQYWAPSWGITPVIVYSRDLGGSCGDLGLNDMVMEQQLVYGNPCWVYFSYSSMFYYILPIITPPEGSAAVSAQAPEVLDRYVALQPNPATDRVTVISSFGLTRIEVRDAAGRKLHDAPASGFSANLDLSRFPSGTLILTIHTPAGPATKKLLKP